ncbi:MAG: DUF3500 domain-containing protein [Chloroflexota bacterium]
MATHPSAPEPSLPDTIRDRSEFLKSYVVVAEEKVAEPFRGLTADGNVIPGLFPIQATGHSTAPVVEAARVLLSELSSEQRATAQYPIDSDHWRRWSNIHPPLLRHGVCLEQMSSAQRQRVYDLLAAGLSAAGYDAAIGVMRLNETVGEMTGRFDEYGDQRYWVSIFGEPSADQPWGWQVDGHHLNLNYFVLGDQVVLSPLFLGSEPVFAEAGKYAGTRVFQAEEERGLRLLRTLSNEQRGLAIIGDELPHDVFGTAFRDNLTLSPQGICYDELDPRQQAGLRSVIETYVHRLRPGHAEVRMDEVANHYSETRFAWIGETSEVGVFYYRVQSPVILLEFDHQRGVAFRGTPVSRNHIHTVLRTPNGNDYGRDLLRQHHERFQH